MLTAGNSALRAGRGILFFIDRACEGERGERKRGEEGEEENSHEMQAHWMVGITFCRCVCARLARSKVASRTAWVTLPLRKSSWDAPCCSDPDPDQREGEKRRISHRRKQGTNNHDN